MKELDVIKFNLMSHLLKFDPVMLLLYTLTKDGVCCIIHRDVGAAVSVCVCVCVTEYM